METTADHPVIHQLDNYSHRCRNVAHDTHERIERGRIIVQFNATQLETFMNALSQLLTDAAKAIADLRAQVAADAANVPDPAAVAALQAAVNPPQQTPPAQ